MDFENLNRAAENPADLMGTASREMSRFNDIFEDATNMTNTSAANGVNVLEQQSTMMNTTVAGATDDWERAVNELARVSKHISNVIDQWVPHMDVFFSILGPLRMVTGGFYFLRILQLLQILPNPQAMALRRISKEFSTVNKRLEEMTEMYLQVESPRVVENITKSSITYDDRDGTFHSYYFYSDNNLIVAQLNGLGYKAFNTMNELLEQVLIWNCFCDAAERLAEIDPSFSNLSKFGKRNSNIYFLDPYPRFREFPNTEFMGFHKSVTIINHRRARDNLTFNCITVRGGCSVRLDYFTVRKIDATFGGKAALYGCNVKWKQMKPWEKPSANPFLFGGSPDKFNNPYNVCGTVLCNEETKYAAPKKICDDLVIPLDEKKSLKELHERTITNISDTDWFVEMRVLKGGSLCVDGVEVDKRLKIKSFGGELTYSISEELNSYVSKGISGGLPFVDNVEVDKRPKIISTDGELKDCISEEFNKYFSKQKGISGGLTFIDEGGRKYTHRFKGKSRLPNFTIVCPRLRGSGSVMARKYKHDDYSQTTENETGDEAKRNVILVVGRFGSGKSTLLNTLAGVHWKLTDGNFSVSTKAVTRETVEMFQTSKSASGCTEKAVAKDITTFDGRQLTVIDTVGYDDSVNADTFYNNSNLTEVMNKYNKISAIVVVINAKDPRLSQGFVESLACVPKSFKKNIQRNIVFVFTKWSADDEEECGDEPCRGFTEQMKIMSMALGMEYDGSDGNSNTKDGYIPTFWMDNRKFKKYSYNARHTVSNLRSFLDHVAGMPTLSYREFMEMRALSQFERAIRKAYKEYFTPSKRNQENPSGFEKFLFNECAYPHMESIKKSKCCVEKVWSDQLFEKMQEEMADKLPDEMQKVCDDVTVKFGKKIFSHSNSEREWPVYVRNALITGGIIAMCSTIGVSMGLSVFAAPILDIIGHAYSKSWKRQDVINRLVFGISESSGNKLYDKVVDAITSDIDHAAEDLQKYFDSINDPTPSVADSIPAISAQPNPKANETITTKTPTPTDAGSIPAISTQPQPNPKANATITTKKERVWRHVKF